MCGVVGFVDFSKKNDEKVLKKMVVSLTHRGPDDMGQSVYFTKYANVGLGHRRLSVQDTSKSAHQPMVFDDLEIIYNGEIYNFKEIRCELEALGYSFASKGDTEVILKAYHKWGIKAIDRFNGMFAVVIYDKKLNKIVFLRDRAGVKPFYYYKSDKVILFSSELKSFHYCSDFHKEVDKNALSLYLRFGYVPQPYTIFKNTHKLKSGHYAEVYLDRNEIVEKAYWDVLDFYKKPKLDIGDIDAIKEVDTLLNSAFEYRMVSDVPVGIFLSGGFDSSVVSAVLQKNTTQKLKTFTIGFQKENYNEAVYAKRIAKYLGTDHTEYYCSIDDVNNIFARLPEIYDEPFGDVSAIPTILVSQVASQEVKVSLSADGGDEIFAGYDKYSIFLKHYSILNKTPSLLSSVIAKVMESVTPETIPFIKHMYNYKTRYDKIYTLLRQNNEYGILDAINPFFSKKQSLDILSIDFSDTKTAFNDFKKMNNSIDPLSKILAIDYKTYLPDDILTKVDRATMSCSLEGREPLLDHRIVEFVAQLPSSLKYRNGDKKWLLKEIAYKYLPEDLLNRPKMGFGPPINYLFETELKKYLIHYLSYDRLSSHGIFNIDEVLLMRDRFLSNGTENIRKIWLILMFEMWYERWM